MSTSDINLVAPTGVGNEVAVPERPVPSRNTNTGEARPQTEEVLLGKTEQEGRETGREQIEEIAEFLNDSASLFNVSLQFKISDDINRIIVSVVNSDTEEVIRQIPADEVIELAKRLNKMVGVLFNETA
jgi:flagellar protein FlaG